LLGTTTIKTIQFIYIVSEYLMSVILPICALIFKNHEELLNYRLEICLTALLLDSDINIEIYFTLHALCGYNIK